MANRLSLSPISFREALVIVSLFMVIFGALLKWLVMFYFGVFIILLLIIERSLGVVFNPGKSKVNLG
jgi:hypothetical protein